MHWLLLAGGTAVLSWLYWSRCTSRVHLEKGLTIIPRSILDKYIQPEVYREVARNYRNAVNPRHPFVIRTEDIANNALCNSTLINTIIEDEGGVYENSTITKLQTGSQGTTYEVEHPTGRKVLKFFNLASSLLIEANSLIGLQLHGHQKVNYELKEIMKGSLLVSQPTSLLKPRHFQYYEKKGDFCATYSFVRGNELMFHTKAHDSLILQLDNSLRLLVQLLRQIQAVHFTLNHHAITEPGNQNILAVHSYANYHSDIHDNNSLIDYYDPDRFDATFIDYGLTLPQLFKDKDDVQIHLYNNVLRNETGLEEENKISIHRILNFGQNMDFCTIAIIIVEFFEGFEHEEVHFKICRIYREDMERKFRTLGKQVHFMTYLREFYDYIHGNEDMMPILQTLFYNVFRPMDTLHYSFYSGWVKLVQLFDTPLY
ncbi:hypothetical protein SNEBB_001329 [Seison nebaliae]|nr:hypothetical protein SNEBB_001329 [Seison nebaliae]